jgi:tRNA pseudouridine32 synthase/23S rRNA pseudouridine746 synthase
MSHVSSLSYDQSNNRSLVQVKIDTGRKHQIRIHLASIGLPIVGDRMHGIKEKDDSEDLQLCAVALTIPCPLTGQSKEYHLVDELQLKLI